MKAEATKRRSSTAVPLSLQFKSLRRRLLAAKFAERLERPLAYWALPSDRQLPYALLGRPLEELLDTPFDALTATPGVGTKKLATLMTLLSRATGKMPQEENMADVLDVDRPAVSMDVHAASQSDKGFDASGVSEAIWAVWRDAVRRLGLCDQKLGRLAPSLRELPTVIWHTPLGEYSELSLAEIRQLKTHGDKRMQAVLHVFCAMYHAAGHAANQSHLGVMIAPQFVSQVERWMAGLAMGYRSPVVGEIRDSLVVPLLDQIQCDAGPFARFLAAGRLGSDGHPISIRRLAIQSRVSRARVYQLLDECRRVMHVRWPEGAWHLASLQGRFRADDPEQQPRRLLDAVFDVFYGPDSPTGGGGRHHGSEHRGDTAHRFPESLRASAG